MTGMSGKTEKTGMSGMSGKTGMSVMTGVPLEGLVAGMPGMSCRTHGWISRRSPCLLCVELDSGWRILWMYCSVMCTCRLYVDGWVPL